LALALLASCTQRAVVHGDDGGPAGPADLVTDRNLRDWVNPAARDYIFLVDETGELLRFDPRSNKLSSVGQIVCSKTGKVDAHSMSVDRHGVAWVNLSPDQLVRVNTTNASCKATGYKAPAGYTLFGMGFAPARSGAKEERLFISSSKGLPSTTGKLAYVNQNTLKVTEIGPYPAAENSPELTGTRNGNLYGYFPGPGTKGSFIARLDQKTGRALATWHLGAALGFQVDAWAFAHWGGRFYQFVSGGTQSSSRVYRYDPRSGKNVLVVSNLTRRVVGAGVSASAPGANNDLGI